jgi:hypothetical protein
MERIADIGRAVNDVSFLYNQNSRKQQGAPVVRCRKEVRAGASNWASEIRAFITEIVDYANILKSNFHYMQLCWHVSANIDIDTQFQAYPI